MLGPQFDQPTIPGLGDGGGEQMTLFRTKELGDGTMRGIYNDAPDARDWVESATRQQVKPKDIDEAWGAPKGDLEYGAAFDEEHLTDAARSRLEEGGDLRGSFRTPLPSDTARLVEGGRAHLASIKDAGDDDQFMAEFSHGTDFGDTRLRAKPYDFRELEFTDTPSHYEGLYAGFTPQGEQVTGMEYQASDVLPDAEVITGAGSNRAMKGHGYGTLTAGRMAAERSQEGVVLHGNSFTKAGAGAFQTKGARNEHQIQDEIQYSAENDPDIIEMATSAYETPDLAEMSGFNEEAAYPEQMYAYNPDSDTINVEGDEFDRGTVARWAVTARHSPARTGAYEYARDYMHDRMLGEQEEMIAPFREHLGVPDRARRGPTQPALTDSGDRGYVPDLPNPERISKDYTASGRTRPLDPLSQILRRADAAPDLQETFGRLS